MAIFRVFNAPHSFCVPGEWTLSHLRTGGRRLLEFAFGLPRLLDRLDADRFRAEPRWASIHCALQFLDF